MKPETVLNHHLIEERYFFPRQGEFSPRFSVECEDGTQLACHYQRIAERAKTLVHFHGNGEIVADYVEEFPRIVNKMGYHSFLSEFRGYGMSGGRPLLGQMLDDVKRIIEATGESPEDIVLFGRSVGSLFALRALSLYPSIAGVVFESGIADPLERLLLRVHPDEMRCSVEDFKKAVTGILDSRRIMENFKGATLILHTRHDGLVDLSHGERLHQWAGGRKNLKVFERGNHNTIMFENGEEYFEALGDFLQSL